MSPFDRALMGVVGALYLAIATGAAMVRSEIVRHSEQEMLTEDREVCERLAAPPGSALFLPCVVELDRVRAGARERSEAQDLDLL